MPWSFWLKYPKRSLSSGVHLSDWSALLQSSLNQVYSGLARLQLYNFRLFQLYFIVDNLEAEAACEILFHHKCLFTLIAVVEESVPFIEEVGVLQVRHLLLVVFWLL